MSGMVRKLNSAEQSFRSDERTLEQEVIGAVLSAVLTPAVERILKNCAGPDGEPDSTLKKYFEALRQDILDHPEGFLPREDAARAGPERRAVRRCAASRDGHVPSMT